MSHNRFLAALAITALLPLAPSALHAQNAKQFTSGTTALTLDSNLVLALQFESVTISPAVPASLNGTTATFPIATGGVDLTTLTGVVYHSGGLTFTSGNTVVTVSQFAILAEPGQKPLMYGLLTVDNKVQGLFPLFDFGGAFTETTSGSTFALNNAAITLSAQGAQLLNTAFGFSGFAQGQAIGTANLSGTIGSYSASLAGRR